MELQWRVDWDVSCWYAATRIIEGAEPISPQAKAIAPQAALLADGLRRFAGGLERSLPMLPAIARQTDSVGQFAERLLVKTVGRRATTSTAVLTLGEICEELLRAARQAGPGDAESIRPRLRPIQEAWEAIGPGLLRIMQRITEPELFVSRADVFLAEPVSGGGGEPYLDFNSVVLEGVLAHPAPQLPETLRLAWLLSQLNNDLPVYNELIPGHRFVGVSKLAMIPSTLMAGEELGLCRGDQATTDLAVRMWLGGKAPTDALASLNAWWETYEVGRVPWRLALTALDQLLVLDD